MFYITTTAWQRLSKLMMRRRTRTALSGLDEHMLKDIGVLRAEIERISRNAAL